MSTLQTKDGNKATTQLSERFLLRRLFYTTKQSTCGRFSQDWVCFYVEKYMNDLSTADRGSTTYNAVTASMSRTGTGTSDGWTPTKAAIWLSAGREIVCRVRMCDRVFQTLRIVERPETAGKNATSVGNGEYIIVSPFPHFTCSNNWFRINALNHNNKSWCIFNIS